MSIDDKLKLEIKELIEKLDSIRGRGTELISVYIPDNYPIHEYANMLNVERSEANNIKSKQTRKNVTSALEKIIGELKKYRQTPKNGLIIFCGNIGGNQSDIKMWTVVPPVPLKHKKYHCDQEFYLKPLKEIIEAKQEVLIASIDKQKMAIAVIKGTRVIPIVDDESHIPGKFRAGGQSAARFQRQREQAKISFLKETGNLIQRTMRDRKLKKIILGGPGPMKDELNSDKYLGPFADKVIGVVDSGYAGKEGFEEILDKSKELLKEEELLEEKQKVKEFLTLLAKKPNLTTYGFKHTLEKISMGVVKTVLISETIDKQKQKMLIEEAQNYSSNTELISTDTSEGKSLEQLGGVGAILRYAIRN